MDLDGDGLTDMLSGSYSPGHIYLFAGRPDGAFAKGLPLAGKDGQPLLAGRRSIPFAFDWNGDGLLDLLVGDMEGEVVLFANQGQPGKPVFASSRPILAAGKPVRVGSYAAPTVADWDGDGLPDLLVAENSGAVSWFRNSGSLGAPALGAPTPLLTAPARKGWLQPGEEPLRSGGRPFISVVDWNRDGVPDLLLGDCQFQQGVLPDPPPVDAQTLAEARKKQTEAQTRLKQLSGAPEGEDEEARQERLAEVAKVRRQLSQAAAIVRKASPPVHVRGWVWLYPGTREAPVRKAL